MIISYEREFVFIHVYKTGGDSVAAALAPALSRQDVVLKGDFQQWIQQRTSATPEVLSLKKHSPARVVRGYLSAEKWDRFYTFAFVRHPISRAASLYSFAKKKSEERQRLRPRSLWYRTPAGQRIDPLRWPSVRAYEETDSFSAFLRHPLVEGAPAMQPQWLAVCDDSRDILVDFVGRFERLYEDFAVIQNRLDLRQTHLPWRNSSGGGKAHQPSIVDEDRELLAQRFQDDFSIFGYDPEAVS